ncbi:ABC transporter substrate-binding protein [Bradyrhizobium iriomotense]|uniref:Amino acid ABC transporter substrate-binding protein n=1 Tax=Bradyrhizobium iriomotense TaxID=441950 RepID=A0ABQ6B512_9BRAD|nr:ABC transporter substrate-binding protein [Bradyrhizobium iriomotense]GLR89499.1 amino acid ABC transporter substrate-binding protein [Bradyrhizobium iriomotense]
MKRRTFLSGAAGLAVGLALPYLARAQGGPLKLGVLTPLTGAGAQDGPRMLKAMQAVVDEVNKAGGVLGRQIALIVEDDQTNPEAAVRAAQKLVGVDGVPVIMGTWASAVTSAVAPVCWDSKTCLMTVSGADSITQLPHQGYIFRTQPTTTLQATKHAEYIVSTGAKKVAYLAVQTPFAVTMKDIMTAVLEKNGSSIVRGVVYEPAKASYRSEIDSVLAAKPDMIYLNSYSPDLTVLLKDLFRAGYTGGRFTQSYAYNAKTAESLPAEVTDGLVAVQPSSDVDSNAYALLQKRLGVASPDSYEAQATDWVSLTLLAIEKSKKTSGADIRDAVRSISQGSGARVASAVEGLKLLREGKDVNYDGASGNCDFNEKGDIIDCRFRYSLAKGAKFELIKIV